MTNLLAELAEVVRLSETAKDGVWQFGSCGPNGDSNLVAFNGKDVSGLGLIHHYSSLDLISAAVNFLRTHHAEIAEAVMDARRYRWLKYNATELTGEYGEAAQLYYGTYRSGPLELDASIDAAMHNSAREGGE